MEPGVSYFDIFTEDVTKQEKISNIFFMRYQKRNLFMKNEDCESNHRPEDPRNPALPNMERNPDPCDPGDEATDNEYS